MSSLLCWILYIMVTTPSGVITRQAILLPSENECMSTAKAYFRQLQDIGYDTGKYGEPEAICKQAISI